MPQICSLLKIKEYSSGILRNFVPFMYYFPSSNIKYIDNQLVTVIKIQMICKCKYKTI